MLSEPVPDRVILAFGMLSALDEITATSLKVPAEFGLNQILSVLELPGRIVIGKFALMLSNRNLGVLHTTELMISGSLPEFVTSKVNPEREPTLLALKLKLDAESVMLLPLFSVLACVKEIPGAEVIKIISNILKYFFILVVKKISNYKII
jgi:hypothetical protein